MVNGVVSLRCPACSRPFLSLPQQLGAMVTCPHCARSAPRESYPAASGPFLHPVTSLPIQRRVQPSRQPIEPAAPSFSAQSPTSPPQPLPAWPPAPEQAPLFGPQPASLFPPAPSAPATWQPMMPSGQSPFGIVPSHLPPAAEGGGQAAPYSPSLPAYMPSMQFAPRHESAGGIGSGEVEYHATPSWRPQREERNVPLGIFLILVLGFGGWVLWGHLKGPMAAEFEAPQTAAGESPMEMDPVIAMEPAPAQVPVADPQAAKETVEVEVTAPAPAVPAPVAMEPEIRRAGVPSEGELRMLPASTAGLNLVRANEEAEALLQSLFKAETATERAAVISQAEEYQVEVEGFFDRSRPQLKLLKLAAEMPLTLPAQEEVPLFQVQTDANPKAGALLRLVPQDGGGFLLDWPLFAETHERRLARFLEQKSGQPSWFHVVLRRSHALDLPAEIRAGQLCFSLHSSADESVECLALVTQETPLGRFFEREVEWDSLHVARLLLQHRPGTGGKVSVVILDCEGAVTGAVFPGGGVKR